jgi:hypothetical protein
MVVPLRPSFTSPDIEGGGKVVPVCTIIGNMTKPSQGAPSLLRFAEVKTCELSLSHQRGKSFEATQLECSVDYWSAVLKKTKNSGWTAQEKTPAVNDKPCGEQAEWVIT